MGRDTVEQGDQSLLLDVTRRFYTEEMLRQMHHDHQFVHRMGPYAHSTGGNEVM